ncbi:glycosyltransferase family 2 protein [Gelidibacter salicanalis]|uniref:Glycosyltransferase family 2 protein n=1 Tax=Gelidibacter salicanalis TaxID=291193 RepID=A0A934KTP3_9FLAO|nr:glycosyltransferase family 2 protein [Gelidibacter salicanalis]MBJ7879250.1 glycosyltransferase family 2 protein [Gelidibacter salicanalis]
MLSILIPVYNYNVVPLVEEIHFQATALHIPFEILVYDDGSFSVLNKKNQQINRLTGCQFIEAKRNRGSAALRQHLAVQAQYDWLLFLDADVMPKHANYLQTYVNIISEEQDAIYGGFAYQAKTPEHDYSLRWRYGKAKEEVDAAIRNQKPYKIVISGNFLTKKHVFITVNSKMKGHKYGYDNYFGALLKEYSHNVKHINNEVYHLGLGKNPDYLRKVEHSVDTLLELHKNNKITESDNDLLNTFKIFKKIKIHYLLGYLFKQKKPRLITNLLSPNPSVRGLQFYKLGYMCYKDAN